MKEKRKFNLSAARLIELAATIQTHFNSREAAFIAHDPTVTSAWLQEQVEKARALTLDAFERGKVVKRTRALNKAIAEMHPLVKRVRYYIGIAFGDETAEFGLSAYNQERRRQATYIQWLDKFSKTVDLYRTEIEAVTPGATEAIETLKTQVREISTANHLQEVRKGIRINNTRKRTRELNKLYDRLLRIEKLAYIVYEQEEEREDLYYFIIPRSYSTSSDTEIENDGGMLRPIDGYEPGTEPPAEGPATPTGTAA